MATQKIYSPAEAQARYYKLPQEVQDFLYSYEMLSTIKEIGQKNGLHIDQVGLLQVETNAVLLGFTEAQDFSSQLAENLHLEKPRADMVAKDVNEKILVKIRETMKKTDEQKKAATPVPPSAPAPAIKSAEAHPADLMLTQKTVTVAPTASKPAAPPPPTPPSAPQPYKADPYREPTT